MWKFLSEVMERRKGSVCVRAKRVEDFSVCTEISSVEMIDALLEVTAQEQTDSEISASGGTSAGQEDIFGLVTTADI